MNQNTAEGKFDQLKGKAKQAVGEAVGNDRLANSGTMDQVKGNAKEAWGNVQDAAGATREDMNTHSEATAHDVRERITSTAQNVKNSVSSKAEDMKEQHRRSA